MTGINIGDRVTIDRHSCTQPMPNDGAAEGGVDAIDTDDKNYPYLVAVEGVGKVWVHAVRKIPNRAVVNDYGPGEIIATHGEWTWVLLDGMGNPATFPAEYLRPEPTDPEPEPEPETDTAATAGGGHRHWPGCHHEDVDA